LVSKIFAATHQRRVVLWLKGNRIYAARITKSFLPKLSKYQKLWSDLNFPCEFLFKSPLKEEPFLQDFLVSSIIVKMFSPQFETEKSPNICSTNLAPMHSLV